MENFKNFLAQSYTCYHAAENAANMLLGGGFLPLREEEHWELKEGGSYFVKRGGSLVAFRLQRGNYKIVASHTDSPCFKLKDSPELYASPFTRLNVEPYGGGIWHTFFDRPLRIAGRIVGKREGALAAETYLSPFCVTIPSLAIHMDRSVNEGFAPKLQEDLPLLALGEAKLPLEDAVAFDLFAVPDEKPFVSGIHGEFLSSPRLDDLTGVYASLSALIGGGEGTCVAALFNNEEIGSHTRQGAAGDLLSHTLRRIAIAQGLSEEEYLRTLATSLFISLDNAHSLHPNHPEKCDPTSRAAAGDGIVIKSHAGGAYTTEAVTAAAMRELFARAGVKHKNFFNRSDMRSGSTLGAISLGQVCLPSVDLGIAQLAMHSAVETIALSDLHELTRGLAAFYSTPIRVLSDKVLLG